MVMMTATSKRSTEQMATTLGGRVPTTAHLIVMVMMMMMMMMIYMMKMMLMLMMVRMSILRIK